MFPRTLAGGIFMALIIVGGISGNLSFKWCCQLKTTPNSTQDNFALVEDIKTEPTNMAPIDWIADKISSVWKYGDKVEHSTNSTPTNAESDPTLMTQNPSSDRE